MPTKKKYTYKQKTSKKKQYNKKKRTIKKRHTRKKTRYGGNIFGSSFSGFFNFKNSVFSFAVTCAFCARIISSHSCL